MAQTLNSDEERDRRIKLVGEYILETGASIRETMHYMLDIHRVTMSVCTAHSYVHRYMEMTPSEAENLRHILGVNRGTIDNPEVRKKVELEASLRLQGYTVEEIAKELGVNSASVYHDITAQLAQFDPKKAKQIKEVMHEARISSLKK